MRKNEKWRYSYLKIINIRWYVFICTRVSTFGVHIKVRNACLVKMEMQLSTNIWHYYFGAQTSGNWANFNLSTYTQFGKQPKATQPRPSVCFNSKDTYFVVSDATTKSIRIKLRTYSMYRENGQTDFDQIVNKTNVQFFSDDLSKHSVKTLLFFFCIVLLFSTNYQKYQCGVLQYVVKRSYNKVCAS